MAMGRRRRGNADDVTLPTTRCDLKRATDVAEAANGPSRVPSGGARAAHPLIHYGYAQLLERSATTAANAVRVIRRSAEHLASLIDGLLDISRIEGGVMKLNRDRLDLRAFLDQLEDMFRLQAAAKGIEFRCQRAAHLPTVVHADERRLRQVLINLLSPRSSNRARPRGAGRAYRNQVAEFEISDTAWDVAGELARVSAVRARQQPTCAIPGPTSAHNTDLLTR